MIVYHTPHGGPAAKFPDKWPLLKRHIFMIVL